MQDFNGRTQLSILHFNFLKAKEMTGKRKVIRRKPVFSKAVNGIVRKNIKESVYYSWKTTITASDVAQILDLKVTVIFDRTYLEFIRSAVCRNVSDKELMAKEGKSSRILTMLQLIRCRCY
uniref:Uncharacterized protein n=1 Tax=Ditylenchus dipsaci TaxID=166011 RepID=A0A915ECT7_9BILA